MTTGWQSRDSLASQLEEPGQDMQARIERLEEWVCVLLLKNQTLRMALQEENASSQSYDYPLDSRPALARLLQPEL
jgi:hypothetical protein